MNQPSDPISMVRWIEAVNDTGAVVPPFGLVGVASVAAAGVHSVAQPAADGQYCLVNGPSPIPANGGAGAVTEESTYASYETADGTPAAGETWGAGAGSFKLRKGKAGFAIIGGVVDGRAWVRRAATGGGPGTLTVRNTPPQGPVINNVQTITTNISSGIATYVGTSGSGGVEAELAMLSADIPAPTYTPQSGVVIHTAPQTWDGVKLFLKKIQFPAAVGQPLGYPAFGNVGGLVGGGLGAYMAADSIIQLTTDATGPTIVNAIGQGAYYGAYAVSRYNPWDKKVGVTGIGPGGNQFQGGICVGLGAGGGFTGTVP